jgi:hypothetical protein
VLFIDEDGGMETSAKRTVLPKNVLKKELAHIIETIIPEKNRAAPIINII